MSTISSWAGNLHGMGTTVCDRAIEGHRTALITVRCIDRPCCLIPSALEVVGGLSEGEGKKGESGKASLEEHFERRTSADSEQGFHEQNL